jgi:endonuclease G, mitochondrial
MKPRATVLIVLLACATGCLIPRAGSQPTPVTPPEIHCKHFIHCYPLGTPPSNDLIIRDSYALSSNDATKFADWVCFYLTCHEVDGDLDLEREWRNDPWLDASETLEGRPTSQDDYRGASAAHQYDRGHLAPLASFKGSRFASQVNFYSNIVPQKTDMNQGPWQRLEDKERDLVRKYGAAWVMTGPLYESPMPPLPNCDEPHQVPSGFWRIVAVNDLGTLRVAAFIFEQGTARKAPVMDHLVTVDAVEQRSGLNFFWQIPGADENAMEAADNAPWAGSWVN